MVSIQESARLSFQVFHRSPQKALRSNLGLVLGRRLVKLGALLSQICEEDVLGISLLQGATPR